MEYKTENFRILKSLLDEIKNEGIQESGVNARDFSGFSIDKEPDEKIKICFILRERYYGKGVKEVFFLNMDFSNEMTNIIERDLVEIKGRGHDYASIIEQFKPNLDINDEILYKYLKQI